jgi:hypothetical protein
MKRIKGIRKTIHKLAMKAVADYYGGLTNQNVLRSVEGDRVELTNEEKSDVWAIKTNMLDKTYTDNLLLV